MSFMMTDTYHVRQSTKQDAALIAHHRRLMFADQGDYSANDLDAMETRYTAWVAPKLTSGDYTGWFAENADGEVIAGVGLWLREWPPILNDETGKQGYIENVYTAPAHRRRGLSRRLMIDLLAWVRETRVTKNIALHAAPIAQPLYESLGFVSESGLMLLWIG
jgi:GNAT superfamily N-acetyltransferase